MSVQKSQHSASIETFRMLLASADKFEKAVRILGKRFAIQNVRKIGRLHTYYPGQRTEMDYTKYGLFLYPTPAWNEPQLFFTGFGVDHFSNVCKGFSVTTAPAARDAIRLYRNCVLPKSFWLPESRISRANEWDVWGIEELIAIDNGMDLVAYAAIIVMIQFGAIILRMPPRRGDMKGTIERFNGAEEQMFISSLPGYISRQFIGLDEKYSKARATAKAKAKLTVAEYIEMLVDRQIERNNEPHPRFKKPRIQVWRDGQEHAPVLMPTGLDQIRTSFAETYLATLTRQGVVADNRWYNSMALHMKFRVYNGKVFVKINADDVRSAFVISHDDNTHVVVYLTNFEFDYPVTAELYNIVLKRLEQKGMTVETPDFSDRFSREVENLQSGPVTATPNTKPSSDVKAASHAAAMPPITAPPETSTSDFDLEKLLGGSHLDD
jgi:hypothetical protein